MGFLFRCRMFLVVTFFGSLWACAVPTASDPQPQRGGTLGELPALVNTTGFLYPFRIDDKTGFIDRRGKVIVEPRFEKSGEVFSQGRIEVMLASGLWGYVDDQARLVIFDQYQSVKAFSEGLAAVQFPGRLWGYIDPAGKLVLPARYKDAGAFHEGLALVSLAGGQQPDAPGATVESSFGYIDQTGRVVIPPRFAEAQDFHEGRAGVRIGKLWGFIDTKGKVVIKPQYEKVGRYSEGRAMVAPNQFEFGYIDMSGRMIIGPHGGEAKEFSEGTAPIRLRGNKPPRGVNPGTQGFLDISGGFHPLPGHSDGYPFSEGIALVCDIENGYCGYVDHSYDFVIPDDLGDGDSFHNGLAYARNSEREGYLDRHGNWVYSHSRR